MNKPLIIIIIGWLLTTPLIMGSLGVAYGYGQFHTGNHGTVYGNLFVSLVMIGWPLALIGGVVMILGLVCLVLPKKGAKAIKPASPR